jgi:hypothetical protein
MKIKFECDWGNDYDWIIIPTILVGFRDCEYSNRYDCFLSGIGIGILFLKLKIEFKIFKVWDYENKRDY